MSRTRYNCINPMHAMPYLCCLNSSFYLFDTYKARSLSTEAFTPPVISLKDLSSVMQQSTDCRNGPAENQVGCNW
ncbi:hypothetical protein XENTR_v10009993 [Xenopus tropicalis]|nr:hypothetical protein XENTR_v10009993 [Xenopus tropicalis]